MNDAVRAQYEAHPYPPRDPADEANRLVAGSPGHLLEINHFLFAGKRDFALPFRVLAAGGGTGDATIMMAQQLSDAGANAEIVHLDISENAQGIARARAEARGLGNVRFVNGSIEDIATLDLGLFDYIDCCGVLHHLDDPVAGLTALNQSLAPDGGMGLMLYAPLGRTGVYHAQAMLRMIAGDDPSEKRIDVARRMLTNLPSTNWLKRNPFVGDHTSLGDAGIFDLLLHSRDRAFSVMEVADLVNRTGLRLVAFIDPLRYEPGIYLKDPDLIDRVRKLPALQRCAFAELMCGNMKIHIFYVVKAENTAPTVAVPDSAEAVPVLRELDGATIARDIGTGKTLSVEFDGIKAGFNLPPLAPVIFMLIDGKRNLKQIHDNIVKAAEGTTAPDWDNFYQQFQQLFLSVNGLGRMFLRYPVDKVADL